MKRLILCSLLVSCTNGSITRYKYGDFIKVSNNFYDNCEGSMVVDYKRYRGVYHYKLKILETKVEGLSRICPEYIWKKENEVRAY